MLGELSMVCSNCGTPRSGVICSGCALLGALGEGERRIGPYTLLGELRPGGSSTVHVAARDGDDALFAIKIARPELVASPEALVAYRHGLAIQKALCRQPNILSLDELGTLADGRPYAVMSLLEGGTLADEAVRRRFARPEAALALMIKVTRAVARAHQRGVLHADLKPDNILFDRDDEPFVSDFGLSRVLAGEAPRGTVCFRGGTPGWMSPEQARQRELTLASDVFSLGILLYWLLAAELPFAAGEAFADIVCAREAPPLRQRYGGPHAWELEQICRRALHKNHELRYRSAAELADELERVARREPIEAERQRPLRRLWKWSQRHQLSAFTLILLGLFALFPLLAVPLLAVRSLRDAVRTQIGFSALAQAGAVMNELHAAQRELERLALEPEITRLLSHDDPRQIPASLGRLAAGADGLSLFSAQGVLKARWPKNRGAPPAQLDYAFRDYFQGQLRFARRGESEVYVARPFHSAGDEQPLLGLSIPLFEQGRYVGALLRSTRARATFGALRMACRGEGACVSALLGPRDRDRPGQPLPDSIYVIAAPGMRLGQEVTVAPALTRRICAELDCTPHERQQFAAPTRPDPLWIDDFVDPVTRVRSVAALAPVGRTGLMVVVATPDAAFNAVAWRILRELLASSWLPLVVALGLFGALVAVPRLYARRGASG